MTERAIDRWGNCGEVVGWDRPVRLLVPIGHFREVGGWYLFKRDKDGAVAGVSPKMLTFCKECPKMCKKMGK